MFCTLSIEVSPGRVMAGTKLKIQQIESFICEHRLPTTFSRLIAEHYSPLAEWLLNRKQSNDPYFLGINGAQGTGKSTLADYLKLALELQCDGRVAVLSIDDFYLTRAERDALAKNVHPLLATRGVPGTHDVQMLMDCIARLRTLKPRRAMALPRFDKALDDRVGSGAWSTITGPIDLIILEGWCVGSAPQTVDALMQPVNALEEFEDASGSWRRYVNSQLEGVYAELFAHLDALVFLQAPNFDAIRRWRNEQERKLAESTSHSVTNVMSRDQIARFIQHYERLTRANLEALPSVADVVLELDDDHGCVRSYFA